MKKPEEVYTSSTASELERARGRCFQTARRLRWAAHAAEQASVAQDPEVRRAFAREALKAALTASDGAGLAAAAIQTAIAMLTRDELEEPAP